MPIRYEECGQAEYDLLNQLISEKFRELVNAKFRLFFDLKKHISQGSIVLAQIFMSDELTRLLTVDEATMESGADYCIMLDAKLWRDIDDVLKRRILFHEIQHCNFDAESKRPYKIRGHEIEGFFAEVEFNADNPTWKSEAAELLRAMYEQEKDDK